MTLTDLIFLDDDIDVKIEFAGDGVDYFDHTMTIVSRLLQIKTTLTVSRTQIDELIISLERITKQIKDYN